MAGDCPSDLCPEYFFDDRTSFRNENIRQLHSEAQQTIMKYGLLRSHIPKDSPLKTEEEIFQFISAIQKSVPSVEDLTTIYSCKHGRILYNKVVRFNDKDREDLIKKVDEALPINLKKLKNRCISSYLVKAR